MEFYTGFMCLLFVTVCRGNEQILSTMVNSNTSLPALDDNSLTTEASRAFNPRPVTATSVRLASQTSGPRDGGLIPSSMTSWDYGSDFTTSFDTNSVHVNIPSVHESDVIIASSSEQIAITQTFVGSGDSVLSVTSANGQSSVMLTSTPNLQAVSSVVPVSHSVILETSVQQSYEEVRQMSSSEVAGHQLTFTQSRVVDTVVSSSPVIPSLELSQSEQISSSMKVPVSSESVIRVTSMDSSIQSSLTLTSALHQTMSDFSEQKQESTQYELYQTTELTEDVSTGWGRFMDQVTESQVKASSHISEQVPVLYVPTSVIAVSSSLVVKPSVSTSTQFEVSFPVQVTSFVSTPVQVSSESLMLSSEVLDIGSVPVSHYPSTPLVLKTQTVSSSSIAEIASSSPPEHSTAGSVPVTATSEPVSSSSSITQQQIQSVSSSPSPTVMVSVSSSTGEITYESVRSEEITYESVTPSSTSVPSLSQMTSSIFVMPSSTEPVTSSVAVSSVSASTTQTSSTTTETPTAHELKDCYFQLTFDVECYLILNNSLVLAEFVGSLENVLVVNLKVTEDKIKLYDPMCGSLIIHVGFTQVPYKSLKRSLYSQFKQKTFEVPIMVNNQWLKLLGVKVIEINAPTTISPIDVPDTGLDKVDLIVIIVACCICGILITIGIILCAKECYRRKYAQSFDLLEVPHVNLKLEDFTLTRIPRPKAMYGDDSVTMQAFMDNSSQRIVKNTGHHDTNGNGVHSNDVHVRMKQNKDGLVVGVTGYSSQKNGVTEKGTKRNTSAGSDVTHPGDPATENLLHKGDSSTPMGAHNPIFVDDESLSTSTDDQSKKE